MLFDLEDELDDLEEVVAEPVIQKFDVDTYIGRYVNRALSLDISKTSTGISIFEDGEIASGFYKLQTVGDIGIAVGQRIVELENEIVRLCNGNTHFDLICVEEAILGINSSTSANAYALNFVIDTLLAKGILTCDVFVRLNNKSWKATIRQLSGVQPLKSGTDVEKKNVIRYMEGLEVPLATKHKEYKSWSAYMKSGYQDALDSIGLMVGAIDYHYIQGKVKIEPKSLQMKVFGDLASALKFAKHDIVEDRVTTSGLQSWYTSLKTREEQEKSYLVKIKNLGAFGVKHKLFGNFDEFFLVVNANKKKIRR